ncbi:MAG TPA: hypothetical protein VFC13_10210 [Actinomycetes bacterium]|nr:hypothetical protein [Actinomycetes bacterium]
MELVRGLDRHPSAAAALDALGVPDQDRAPLAGAGAARARPGDPPADRR